MIRMTQAVPWKPRLAWLRGLGQWLRSCLVGGMLELHRFGALLVAIAPLVGCNDEQGCGPYTDPETGMEHGRFSSSTESAGTGR